MNQKLKRHIKRTDLQYGPKERLLGKRFFSEGFIKTLEVDRVNDRDYWTREEAKADIPDYIERFYNRKRRHSYLGYMSRVEYELQNAA